MSMVEIVGIVAALARYPVKSMAGEPLAQAELRWNGVHGDRQYSFYRLGVMAASRGCQLATCPASCSTAQPTPRPMTHDARRSM
jgi:uncharacterized protein YcbX